MTPRNTDYAASQLLSPTQSKAACALLAWNQQELAQRAQIGIFTVADFERGKRTPTFNNIEAMRAAFTMLASVSPTVGFKVLIL